MGGGKRFDLVEASPVQNYDWTVALVPSTNRQAPFLNDLIHLFLNFKRELFDLKFMFIVGIITILING